MSRRRWLMLGAAGIVVVAGFLLFRPDTLFTDVRADESLEDAFAGSSSATTVVEPVSTEAGSTVTTSTTASTTTTPVEGPVEVSSGMFAGIDHSAVGTVKVFEQNGRHVLRFEDDTDIQNGPDLYVWVLPATSYEGGSPEEYLDLGTLTGTVGGQNYELPDTFDPDLHRTVLIWCLRFAVPFAAAPLG